MIVFFSNFLQIGGFQTQTHSEFDEQARSRNEDRRAVKIKLKLEKQEASNHCGTAQFVLSQVMNEDILTATNFDLHFVCA